MMDVKTSELLSLINRECDGKYKVLSFDEILEVFPKKTEVDKNVLREVIKALKDDEFISVKYEDENEVCVAPLPKGKRIFQNKIDEEIEKNRLMKCYFKYGFLGGLTGSFAVGLIFSIINLFIR